ncbi:hypothetical protein NMY22_g2239 [Coprinellus aureogranulatus]|nr:hypothetical protein NMY22_g2239 [Coprinellus aureogranulatus]
MRKTSSVTAVTGNVPASFISHLGRQAPEVLEAPLVQHPSIVHMSQAIVSEVDWPIVAQDNAVTMLPRMTCSGTAKPFGRGTLKCGRFLWKRAEYKSQPDTAVTFSQHFSTCRPPPSSLCRPFTMKFTTAAILAAVSLLSAVSAAPTPPAWKREAEPGGNPPSWCRRSQTADKERIAYQEVKTQIRCLSDSVPRNSAEREDSTWAGRYQLELQFVTPFGVSNAEASPQLGMPRTASRRYSLEEARDKPGTPNPFTILALLMRAVAATHPPDSTLQILAGPGSGKTRVLTSRIAHLILNCHIPPMAICAVTFTNKAANEMRERLTKLLGKTRVSQLKMGTFHSLCARLLRKYAKLVDVPDNFTVCDASESKKIITAHLKVFEKDLKDHEHNLEAATVASIISTAKAKGLSAEDYLEEARSKSYYKGASGTKSPLTPDVVVGEVYVLYEASLRQNNALDFDDLLVFGVKLFSHHPVTVEWCRHILVDEFQDTNVTQYDLMRAIGSSARCITIVGDPDQSNFPETAQIFLEENYRSTGAILEASLEIVSQDSKRIAKSLYTAHPDGIAPILYQVSGEQEEAAFIAVEIKRLVAEMGGAFKWGDFAILLRFNALSRTIENALQKEGIPCRILGGHKFFERLEVKDVLAYLQILDNPAFIPALLRVINIPGRGIGEKTLADILQRAEKAQKPPLTLLEGIFDMRIPDSKPSIRKKIAPFVQTIRKLRQSAESGAGPSDLITELLDLVEYQDHLRKTQPDWETRWENVKELITFAKEVEEQNARDNAAIADAEDESSLNIEMSALRQFLQVSMLSSAGDNESEESNQEKVTITTCHSAKGLEWPVVIIPSVDATTYPFIRSEDEDEERRLLYVACTRAKALLYLTRATTRRVAGDTKARGLSKFVQTIMEKRMKENKLPLFIQHVPHLELEDRAILCKVLERPEPEEGDVELMVEAFNRLGREHPPAIPWAPVGQTQTGVPLNWSYPPSYPSSTSTSAPQPLASFSRPVVVQFGRPNAPSSAAFSTTAEFRHPSQVASRSQPPSAPQPLPTTRSSASEHDLLAAPAKSASKIVSLSSWASGSAAPLVTPRTAGHNVLSEPVRSTTLAAGAPMQVPVSRALPLATAIGSKPRLQILRPGENRIAVTPTAAQASRPFPLVKEPPKPLPERVTSQSAPLPQTDSGAQDANTLPQNGSLKRRLGMGPRTAGGYSNKKFKPPTK